MTEPGAPPAVALLGRAVALLGEGGGSAELRRIVEREAPQALAARLPGRTVTGALAGEAATMTIEGRDLGRCRVIVELTAAGVHARLDLGGEALLDAFADVPLRLDYPADALPSDHRWWSDLGGILMVGELSAAPG